MFKLKLMLSGLLFFLGAQFLFSQSTRLSNEELALAESGDLKTLLKNGKALVKKGKAPADIEKGLVFLKRASDQNSAEAQYELALLYEREDSALQNLSTAFYYLELAAKNQHVKAMRHLSWRYLWGTGVPQDLGLAYDWYDKSSWVELRQFWNELAPASLQIASSSKPSPVVEKVAITQESVTPEIIKSPEVEIISNQPNFSTAPTLKKKPTAWQRLKSFFLQGSVAYQYKQGLNYYYGTGGKPQDDKKAFQYFSSAAELDDVRALNYLGIMYQNGRGVPVDLEKAFVYYQFVAEKRDKIGEYNLAWMLANGKGTTKNIPMALAYYERSAKQGYSGASYNLGWMYYYGEDVPEDYEAALKWFRLAATDGNAGAQNYLGLMYQNGHGVTQDYQEAKSWFEKAVAQRYMYAEYNLAYLYENGLGVSKDLKKALSLYLRSARQNYEAAQVVVGNFYSKGLGTRLDVKQAWAWNELACSQSNEQALQVRDAYRKKVPPEDLEAAEKLKDRLLN